MPLFSRFTPLGLYKLSNRKPSAQSIYEQNIANYGDKPQRDLSPGSRDEAMAYAQAITSAVAYEQVVRAGNERLPSRTSGMLEVHEASRDITAPASATVRDRRAELAARWKLPGGAKRQVVEDGLRAILGSHFVRYQTQDVSSFVTRYPSSCGDWPMSLQRNDMVRKAIRLTGPVAFVGVPVTVGYDVVAGARPVAGDVVVFDVGKHGLMDRVTLTKAALVEPFNITAEFQHSHEAGSLGFTGTFPYWIGARRMVLVVVDTFAANDQELRRKVDEYMARNMRAVTTWATVEDNAGGLMPFRLGESSLGRRVLT